MPSGRCSWAPCSPRVTSQRADLHSAPALIHAFPARASASPATIDLRSFLLLPFRSASQKAHSSAHMVLALQEWQPAPGCQCRDIAGWPGVRLHIGQEHGHCGPQSCQQRRRRCLVRHHLHHHRRPLQAALVIECFCAAHAQVPTAPHNSTTARMRRRRTAEGPISVLV